MRLLYLQTCIKYHLVKMRRRMVDFWDEMLHKLEITWDLYKKSGHYYHSHSKDEKTEDQGG